MLEPMECQHSNNCGGYCETEEERSYNLCENCLDDDKDETERKRKRQTLIDEARSAVKLHKAIMKEGAGAEVGTDCPQWFEKIVYKLADLCA